MQKTLYIVDAGIKTDSFDVLEEAVEYANEIEAPEVKVISGDVDDFGIFIADDGEPEIIPVKDPEPNIEPVEEPVFTKEDNKESGEIAEKKKVFKQVVQNIAADRIKDELKAMQDYKNDARGIEDLGKDLPCDCGKKIADNLKDLAKEENQHIGELENIMNKVTDGEFEKEVQAGKDESKEEINENIYEDPFDVDFPTDISKDEADAQLTMDAMMAAPEDIFDELAKDFGIEVVDSSLPAAETDITVIIESGESGDVANIVGVILESGIESGDIVERLLVDKEIEKAAKESEEIEKKELEARSKEDIKEGKETNLNLRAMSTSGNNKHSAILDKLRDMMFPAEDNTITENEKTDALVDEPDLSFNEWLKRVINAFLDEEELVDKYKVDDILDQINKDKDFKKIVEDEYNYLKEVINESLEEGFSNIKKYNIKKVLKKKEDIKEAKKPENKLVNLSKEDKKDLKAGEEALKEIKKLNEDIEVKEEVKDEMTDKELAEKLEKAYNEKKLKEKYPTDKADKDCLNRRAKYAASTIKPGVAGNFQWGGGLGEELKDDREISNTNLKEEILDNKDNYYTISKDELKKILDTKSIGDTIYIGTTYSEPGTVVENEVAFRDWYYITIKENNLFELSIYTDGDDGAADWTDFSDNLTFDRLADRISRVEFIVDTFDDEKYYVDPAEVPSEIYKLKHKK